MSAPPFLPAELSALRVTANSSPCEVRDSAAGTTDKLSAFIAWFENADGTPGDGLKEWLSGLGGFGTSGGTELAAPTGVTASLDQGAHVRVQWLSVSAATNYTVFRGAGADTGTMGIVAGPLTSLEFLDTTAIAGTHYFYAVKASNTTLISGFSSVAEGVRASGGGGFPHTVEYQNTSSVRTQAVPTGATAMEIQIWGGGGRGGTEASSGSDSWVPVGGAPFYYGGGGASGSFLRITGVTVSFGQSYVLEVGLTGQSSSVYLTTAGSATKAWATGGTSGGDSSKYSTPGIGGTTPASAGDNNLGTGTKDVEQSGNPGSDGTTSVAGAGGAAIAYDGKSAGIGGVGTRNNTRLAGGTGMIRLIFTN